MTTMRRAPPPDGALLSPSFSSSFSARYGIHQMLESPLPSPALPSIVPRHGKKPPNPPYVRRALRHALAMLKWTCGLGVICWLLTTGFWKIQAPLNSEDPSLNEELTMVEDGISSTHPLPVVISDQRGAPRWTMSLPSHLDFPLKPSEYASICRRSDDLARRLRHPSSNGDPQQIQDSQGYYSLDSNFLDIREAEEHGLLPGKHDHGVTVVQEKSGSAEEAMKPKHIGGEDRTCEKSLTYVLETTDAGLGKSLMGLWIAYGLAKEEGRAFFVDDAHWYS